MTGSIRAYVLVVDDHLDACCAMSRLLQRSGYDVACAHSGTAAMVSMRGRLPSLVILDQMMPGMSGADVLREMRASDPLRGVPVIVFSGIGTSDEALRAGATEFLAKPLPFTDVLQRVKAYVG
jgi:CheY-like chemotaxis protein